MPHSKIYIKLHQYNIHQSFVVPLVHWSTPNVPCSLSWEVPSLGHSCQSLWQLAWLLSYWEIISPCTISNNTVSTRQVTMPMVKSHTVTKQSRRMNCSLITQPSRETSVSGRLPFLWQWRFTAWVSRSLILRHRYFRVVSWACLVEWPHLQKKYEFECFQLLVEANNTFWICQLHSWPSCLLAIPNCSVVNSWIQCRCSAWFLSASSQSFLLSFLRGVETTSAQTVVRVS